jgi:hypothetical protein
MTCPQCGGPAHLLRKTKRLHTWTCDDWLCQDTWEVPIEGPEPQWTLILEPEEEELEDNSSSSNDPS